MNKLFATVTAPVPNPAPAVMFTRSFLRDLVMDALIGVYDHERDNRQRIRLNVELEMIRPGMTSDAIADLVKEIIEAGHTTLVETLAERIAAQCLDDLRVQSARVRVEKLDVFPDAASVGVEIERHR